MEQTEDVQTRYYAAYDQNLILPWMAIRCPTAKVVGSDVLQDWRLRFRGTPGNAIATIERENGHTVPVVVFSVQPEDEKALDGFEGWPKLYRKEEIVVKVDGNPVTAFTYIMNEGSHSYNQPGPFYRSQLMTGYQMNNFDLTILMNAIESHSRG